MEEDGFLAHPPAHPVPQLQGPFEESMVESINDVTEQDAQMDSLARRTMLLEMPRYERVIAGRWKQKPGERFHPLWKITAQVSFGMHLLAEGMAKSEDEVMKILQSHVDDIDGFLERTGEDFDLAQSDIQERLRYLKLPLEHLDVFDRMLEDRAFRMSIVDGNEKIEHIVERTSEAMKDAMKDVQKGLDATKALKSYLSDLETSWVRTSVEQEAVFVAMIGNVEGWSHAFMDLHLQGNKLGKSLVQLSEIVAEMQKRAGIVSRRTIIQPRSSQQPARRSQRPSSSRPERRPENARQSSRTSSNSLMGPPKALPHEPAVPKPTRNSGRNALPRQSPSTEKHAIVLSPPQTSNSQERETGGLQPPTPGSFLTARSQPSTPVSEIPIISELAANEVPTPSLAPKPLQPRAKNTIPMELPADIPAEVLRGAPMSKQNRLSLTLGLDPRSAETTGRKSFTPSVLADLQETNTNDNQRSQQLVEPLGDITPKAVSNPSLYTNLQGQPSTSNTTTPQIKQRAEKAQDGLDGLDGTFWNEGLGIQGIEGFNRAVVTPDRSSPNPRQALFSNPPDAFDAGEVQQKKVLATGPIGLPTPPTSTTPNQTQTSLHKSQKSSLGEPGPEIDNDEAIPQQGSTLLDAIAKRSAMTAARLGERGSTVGGKGVTEATSEAAGIPFYAEMEGSTPLTLAPRTFAPVELEAAPQRLTLPPRESSTQPNGDALSATITSQEDFYKLHQSAKPPPKAVSRVPAPNQSYPHASMPAPRRVELIKLVRDERSSLPPKLLITGGPQEARHLLKARSGLLDSISDTPPESPIHERSLSQVSSHSAHLLADRASNVLAPPAECPAPPAPGGRHMVNPNYANAAAFDGERKSKHGSKSSSGSWKRLFTGRASQQTTPGGSRPESSRAASRPESAGQGSGVDLMTAGGKDILWFKGMRKDGVWVK